MNNKLMLVVCVLALSAMALCAESAVPSPAAALPFIGGFILSLKRRRK